MNWWIEVVRNKNRASVLVLLSLVATLNASQAMVLCVGCDGHVAIEPAGHDHCADGTHECDSDAAVHDASLAPDAGGADCRGCMDISLADAIGSDPGASARGISAATLVVASQSQIPPDDAASTDISVSASLIFYHVPLRSIMLQV